MYAFPVVNFQYIVTPKVKNKLQASQSKMLIIIFGSHIYHSIFIGAI